MEKLTSEDVLQDKAMTSLENVIDPELGVDIVNLGLIYNIECLDGKCTVTMTLTTMGCPISDLLLNAIKDTILGIEGIDSCEVNLVWSPAWSVDKMSRYARLLLGIYST